MFILSNTAFYRDMHTSYDPNQLAGQYFVRAEHFKRMKMANANNPVMFFHYAEQEYYHKALAHRYQGIAHAAER
ncbi:hypothetical protein M3650_03965 [Paenibacillus sp. MER TA 81-3]|uniref:hypothetical protein n=1 Tax=Paenibacillus sp. MER TA 81-3 TaxID=2939573 RepID=UPI00203D9AA1|nr:hypothetical protein [Paenibacillus sp. MER TA 81-3]MCM3337813.1 hypothetical protein [Paenibacillus sp. MER TA 81-3]